MWVVTNVGYSYKIYGPFETRSIAEKFIFSPSGLNLPHWTSASWKVMPLKPVEVTVDVTYKFK